MSNKYADLRVDPFLDTVVHVVKSRQDRPNLPSAQCPFCVGGLEAPEPYVVRAFSNRWPALGDQRCEVVLYTPDHDATFASLGSAGARRVIDLWAERTDELSKLPGVEFVLVFENRGPEVGATIAHPHGQIYAFDHIPQRPLQRLLAGWSPDPDPGERLVLEVGGWRAYTQHAPVYPMTLSIAPMDRIPDLGSATDASRDQLAVLLVDLCARLDRYFDRPLPYMMWLNQAPHLASTAFAEPWFNIELVSPWRAAGVSRYIAAAEVACGEYFVPISPEDVSERLRQVGEKPR